MATRGQAHQELGKLLGLSAEEASAAVERHMSALNAQEIMVLNLFYALNHLVCPQKNLKIAERMKKSREHVRQIRERAIEKIRKELAKEEEERK